MGRRGIRLLVPFVLPITNEGASPAHEISLDLFHSFLTYLGSYATPMPLVSKRDHEHPDYRAQLID